MIVCPRQTRFALPLARLLPVTEICQVGLHFPNGILDHGAAIDERHVRESLTEVPVWQRMGVFLRCYRLTLCPSQQLISTDGTFTLLLMLLRKEGHPFGELLTVR